MGGAQLTAATVMSFQPTSLPTQQRDYVERTITTSDGVPLGVRDFGTGDDATHTVVLLHGLCLTQDSWAIQIRHLIRRWGNSIRIVTYDHRGHGRSTAAPTHSYQVDRLGADLAEVITTLHIAGPVTIAGHSMGGMAALAYLARPLAEQPIHPDGLVLIATAAGKLAERGLGRLLATPATAMLCELVNLAPRAATNHLIAALTRPVCAALNTYAGYGRFERQALTKIIATCLQGTTLTTAVGFLPGLRRYDAYHALQSIAARTVVVSGGADILTPTAHALDLASGIADATHLHLPAAGHMLLHEAPRMVCAAIDRAISEHTAHTHHANHPRPKALEAL